MYWKHNKALVTNAKSLRGNMTPEERHLWYDFLRDYPMHIQRQKILGHYIADFYCAEAALIIELDGSQHYEEEGLKYDEERTKYLNQFGITVLRIANNEIKSNFRGVCEYIDLEIKKRTTGDNPSVTAETP